ncbi:MAG: hypothetical protein A2W61_03470 [Deltaproteobacteria bacterium RIFCSPLOWO2_01_44_7]|nr:MAG: hypothetical protein A2712_06340 [Deltaproteobacteria bacterium RIFCSPHIGHO2_01_FULL_43_49]OGQ16000.1 MAG: hypothetical protein A3D22_06330 [Deltaproteobacteria bacterium RIFCSPHIGHO2_02_FULL_44_53]OGQ28957.1 MAG: hypothetical protein A3D98_03915 [Deltaproteobacteria bacterium RIFCSPHIGHO2_12_FULL_44_21]OGQ33172.1 MAG: hypothetical protein A2979_04110 [Deltaproteobacteria bacterium RIFCSPLOWO2_01_FULL_45_74]OGQ41626.1 MAG: hypothetical protein A2W61_03470 [Deltaproteobacteria bacterium 
MQYFKVLLVFLFALTTSSVLPAKETSITKNQAVQSVKSLPEVKKYLSKVPNALVEVDNDLGDEWLVHVYEIKDNHTATMNWFTVDKKTGKIKKTL